MDVGQQLQYSIFTCKKCCMDIISEGLVHMENEESIINGACFLHLNWAILICAIPGNEIWTLYFLYRDVHPPPPPIWIAFSICESDLIGVSIFFKLCCNLLMYCCSISRSATLARSWPTYWLIVMGSSIATALDKNYMYDEWAWAKFKHTHACYTHACPARVLSSKLECSLSRQVWLISLIQPITPGWWRFASAPEVWFLCWHPRNDRQFFLSLEIPQTLQTVKAKHMEYNHLGYGFPVRILEEYPADDSEMNHLHSVQSWICCLALYPQCYCCIWWSIWIPTLSRKGISVSCAVNTSCYDTCACSVHQRSYLVGHCKLS